VTLQVTFRLASEKIPEGFPDPHLHILILQIL
jgi:hypothetical protein